MAARAIQAVQRRGRREPGMGPDSNDMQPALRNRPETTSRTIGNRLSEKRMNFWAESNFLDPRQEIGEVLSGSSCVPKCLRLASPKRTTSCGRAQVGRFRGPAAAGGTPCPFPTRRRSTRRRRPPLRPFPARSSSAMASASPSSSTRSRRRSRGRALPPESSTPPRRRRSPTPWAVSSRIVTPAAYRTSRRSRTASSTRSPRPAGSTRRVPTSSTATGTSGCAPTARRWSTSRSRSTNTSSRRTGASTPTRTRATRSAG